MIDNGDDQNADQQQELNKEQRFGQGWATFVEALGYHPNAGDRENEYRNGENLRQVRWPTAHQESGYYNQVSCDVRCKQLEVQEANDVYHARNCAEQRWKAVLQTSYIGTAGRRVTKEIR